jgi:hypothetical protein
MRTTIFGLFACSFFACVLQAQAPTVPVFKITPEDSTIRFGVKASVSIEGTFDQVGRHFDISVH